MMFTATPGTVTRSSGRMLAVLIAACALSTPAIAQTIVVPNSFAATPGTSGLNTLVRDAGNPRTYQMIISSSQLASIPSGSILTGVQWRSWSGNAAGSWPPAPTSRTWSDYDMFLAPAANPVGAMSTTFANNVGPGEVQVLDGPLTINTGTFTSLGPGMVNPWGQLIAFDTGYTYNGGDLVFTARHPGSNEVGALFLDAVASGVANGVQTMTATGATATVGAASTSIIFQFSYVIPGPSGLALMGLAGLVGPRRRRN